MTNFGSTRLCVSKATITRMNVGSLLPLSASCVPRLRQALAGGRGLVTLDMNGLLPGNLSSSVFRRTLFGQSFEVGEIQAYRREKSGSRHAQWARQNKMIPGIIYGPDESGKRAPVELVYVREADLRREVNKRSACFTNTLYDMCVPDGENVCESTAGGISWASINRISAIDLSIQSIPPWAVMRLITAVLDQSIPLIV